MAADIATNCTLETGYDNTLMYINHRDDYLKMSLTTEKKYATIDNLSFEFEKGGGRAILPADSNIKYRWCFGDNGGKKDGLMDKQLWSFNDNMQGWNGFNQPGNVDIEDYCNTVWELTTIQTMRILDLGWQERKETTYQQGPEIYDPVEVGTLPDPQPKPPWPPPWFHVARKNSSREKFKSTKSNIKHGWCFGDIEGMMNGLRDRRLCRSNATTQGWTTFNFMDGEEDKWNNNRVVTQSVGKQGMKMRREEAVQHITANNLLHQTGAIPALPPTMADYSLCSDVNWMMSTVEFVLQNNNSDNTLENGSTYRGEDLDVCSIYTQYILHKRGVESVLDRLVTNDYVAVPVSQAETVLSQAPPSDIGVVGPMV